MRIERSYRSDQELMLRFLDVLGEGSTIVSGNKRAGPGFFIFAHTFIQEFVVEGFFKKEQLLLTALENNGFPADDGPVGAMHAEQSQARDASQHILNAAKGWQDGDEEARGETAWATGELTSTLRKHMDRLKNLIFPLLEQNITPEDEHMISEGLNKIGFEINMKGDVEKYIKLLEMLEDELSDWK